MYINKNWSTDISSFLIGWTDPCYELAISALRTSLTFYYPLFFKATKTARVAFLLNQGRDVMYLM